MSCENGYDMHLGGVLAWGISNVDFLFDLDTIDFGSSPGGLS